MKNIPHNWPQLVQFLEGYIPRFTYRFILWDPPPMGWYKCNSDGASRGNLGERSILFCVRDHNGNTMFAKASCVPDT